MSHSKFIGQLNRLLTYKPTSILIAEKIKQGCENHLTLNSNLWCQGSSLRKARGSVPWLTGKEYKIFGLIEFKISADEFRTGAGKVKQILSLIHLLVAGTSLVSLLSSSCHSGTWVVKLILRLSVELMNTLTTTTTINQKIKLDKVSNINKNSYERTCHL